MKDRASRIAAVVLLLSLVLRVVYVLATSLPALVEDAAGLADRPEVEALT